MSDIKCSCFDCDNTATHTWSGHPTCDLCGSPSRARKAAKPFDITKHEFSDGDACIDYVNTSKDKLIIETSIHTPVILNKKDSIAIAKALGVTAEDLK